MEKASRIFVAGHRGLVGSAIHRNLKGKGFRNLIVRSRDELDLSDSVAVDEFFVSEKPEYLFMAAAKVGGVLANSAFPAEFLYQNLVVQTNVIHSAYRHGVKKLQFLGSSCIYPRHAPQPIKEEYLMTGELEPTNEWYAIAKIAGLKMAQAYRLQYGFNAISLMPTNLYGPGDNFDLQSSHVLPALLRKFHEAKIGDAPEVVVWGSGSPRREFLHVDDLADAAVHLMSVYDEAGIINVGAGEDLSIRQLADMIGSITGYAGRIVFDASKPDGMPRKLLDVTRVNALGWRPKISLQDGIERTYSWYLSQSPHSLSGFF